MAPDGDFAAFAGGDCCVNPLFATGFYPELIVDTSLIFEEITVVWC